MRFLSAATILQHVRFNNSHKYCEKWLLSFSFEIDFFLQRSFFSLSFAAFCKCVGTFKSPLNISLLQQFHDVNKELWLMWSKMRYIMLNSVYMYTVQCTVYTRSILRRTIRHEMECGRNYNIILNDKYICVWITRRKKKWSKLRKHLVKTKTKQNACFMFMLRSEACNSLNGKEFTWIVNSVELLGQLFLCFFFCRRNFAVRLLTTVSFANWINSLARTPIFC